MKIVTFFALFFVFSILTGCEKETERNTYDVTVQSIESGCAIVISFHQEDIPTVKKITATESNSGNYYAFGLSSDTIEKGQTLSVKIRAVRSGESTNCPDIWPSFPWVAIEEFQIKQ